MIFGRRSRRPTCGAVGARGTGLRKPGFNNGEPAMRQRTFLAVLTLLFGMVGPAGAASITIQDQTLAPGAGGFVNVFIHGDSQQPENLALFNAKFVITTGSSRLLSFA